jgi:hypothetical protein
MRPPPEHSCRDKSKFYEIDSIVWEIKTEFLPHLQAMSMCDVGVNNDKLALL